MKEIIFFLLGTIIVYTWACMEVHEYYRPERMERARIWNDKTFKQQSNVLEEKWVSYLD